MKKIIIKTCRECPYFFEYCGGLSKRNGLCLVKDRKLKTYIIPLWCPLPDAQSREAQNIAGRGPGGGQIKEKKDEDFSVCEYHDDISKRMW